MLTESESNQLAVALGYEYVGQYNNRRPLREYVLPVDWYRIIGPFVIVRELILDSDGQSKRDSLGRARLKRKVRLLPR